MNRAQFLETLRSQLTGKMYAERVEAHLRYYEDYIQSQVRGGRSEDEVLEELGDPRLIARTLLDTDTSSGDAIYEEVYNRSDSGRNDSYSENGEARGQNRHRQYRLDLTTWYGKLIVFVIAALVIFLLVTALTVVLPFLLIFALLMFLISRFRNR